MTYDQQPVKEEQLSFEFDYEELREREITKAREKKQAETEYRKWLEEKECND